MTTRARFVALLMVALMVASSVIIYAPAALAQDTVPTKSQVPLQPIPNLRQYLYPRFSDTGAAVQPDCTHPTTSASLQLAPAPEPTSGQAPRTLCGFTAGAGDAAPAADGAPTAPGNVHFTTPTSLFLNRRVTLTGNTSFAYHHVGPVEDGVTLTVTVKSDTQSLASGVIEGDSQNTQGVFDIVLVLTGTSASNGRAFLEANKSVVLSIVSTGPPIGDGLPTPGGVLPSSARWEIDDTESYLEIRAEDAIRAATWITDERDTLRTLFAPIANESLLPSDANRRIVGHFALQSAFGFSDTEGDAPEFSILDKDGHSIEIASGGRAVLVGQENTSTSVRTLGVRAWSFPRTPSTTADSAAANTCSTSRRRTIKATPSAAKRTRRSASQRRACA
jgi:hypothetical protein